MIVKMVQAAKTLFCSTEAEAPKAQWKSDSGVETLGDYQEVDMEQKGV